jgi:hypothetical protein
MSAPHSLLTSGTTLVLLGCSGPKLAAPVVELPNAADTASAPYAEVTEGVWLGGDRWAVLAPPDETVGIVDLASRAVAPLGGPKSRDIRNPATVFRQLDTLYVGDWGLRRTTLWSLEGHLVRSVPAADAARGVLPRVRDAAGHFYLEMSPRSGPDGSGNRDSGAVVRTDPEFRRLDTVAQLAPLDIAEVEGDAGRRFERRIFSGTDRWGVLPDASLWVARVYDNRVDWRDPSGRWIRGEPLPDRVLEVTRYDRELFLRRFPPELRRTAEQLPFAVVKPPFEAGFTAPNGDVWLEKSRAPADSSRRYQVVNRQGRIVREIRVPGRGRIVALGQDAVLVAEPAPDATRLLRFPIPQTQVSR